MKNQEINDAIASILGWISDFSEDLNAMHKAASWLREKDYDLYRNYNDRIGTVLFVRKGGWEVFKPEAGKLEASEDLSSIDAPAIVRAEAFLKTLEKWRE